MDSKAQFKQWIDQGYNWLPMIEEMMGDLETPLSLYLKLANTPYSYLLESAVNGSHLGRYSIIGLASATKITIKENFATYIRDNILQREDSVSDPLGFIQEIMDSFKVPSLPSHDHFVGGFVGYFGYDTIRYIEPRLASYSLKDQLNIPDIFLMLAEELVVYDNLLNKMYLIVYVPSDKDAYERGLAKLKALKQKLKEAATLPNSASETQKNEEFISNFSQEDFETNVKKAKEYFLAGDAMQMILSQRFSRKFTTHPLQLYRALRQLNPSPYMYYFNLDNLYIVGASPEILVRVHHSEITVRPLAGTRRRGKTKEEDLALEKELLADIKERAEHLMLIDLGRNDIGRVSEIGTVKVTEQMVIERFSHVMHISSTVKGKIKPEVTLIDALRATFPAGTVSGAPKIRAMEIIDELEHDKRGIYGGAIGYLGWNNYLDLAIALRTAVIKDETIYVQAGAGLVADSIPKNEWQECINKAKVLFLAAELAENMKGNT